MLRIFSYSVSKEKSHMCVALSNILNIAGHLNQTCRKIEIIKIYEGRRFQLLTVKWHKKEIRAKKTMVA